MNNKAPKKIYFTPLLMEDGESIVRRCTFERQSNRQIEYTRTDVFTDVFIEKACEYLFENYHGEKLSLRMIEDFKKYMEGE